MRAWAAGLVLAVAACGSRAREPRVHEVAIRAMQFVPADLAVAVGDTVVWTNHDVMPHTVTSAAGAPLAFDSQQLASKARWQLVVTTPGTLRYTCTYHPTMHATVTAR